MYKKIFLFLTVLLAFLPIFAQVDDSIDTFAEDTVSANYEAAITCPTIDSIIQLAFAKKPTAIYKYGAAGPNHFDCSGFVYYCFGQHGIKLPRSSRDMFLVGQKVKKEDLQPGDLVFFSRGKLEIGHVGIVIETNIDGNNNFRFIHSSTYKTNVRVDNSLSPNYATRYKGARRIISCDGIGGNATILPSDTVISDTIPPIPTASTAASSNSQFTSATPQKPAPVQQQSTVKYHKIKKGETLSSIARKYHTTVANLKKWNKLKSDLIREGQRIIVAK